MKGSVVQTQLRLLDRSVAAPAWKTKKVVSATHQKKTKTEVARKKKEDEEALRQMRRQKNIERLQKGDRSLRRKKRAYDKLHARGVVVSAVPAEPTTSIFDFLDDDVKNQLDPVELDDDEVEQGEQEPVEEREDRFSDREDEPMQIYTFPDNAD